MLLITFLIIAVSIGYTIYYFYRNEAHRQVQLNLHLLQAKQLLENRDLNDKRSVFINRFKEAENQLLSAQAYCIKQFEFQSITDIRSKLSLIRQSSNN